MEATEEQFSVPITAHSSWSDCCVAVILLVGGRRAESLHKDCLPVAAAWGTVFVCMCLNQAFFFVHINVLSLDFKEQFNFTYNRHLPHFKSSNKSRKKEAERIDYHFTAGLIESVTGTVQVSVK